MLVRKSEQIIFAFLVGALCGLCISFFADDLKANAAANEAAKCPEKPDQAAFMGRKPGESHNVEACLYMMRYGDPRWIPEFSHPLKATPHR